MKPSHTATPWHTGEGAQSRIIYAPDGFAVADAAVFHGRHESSAEDNAAFIVRACNAHDDLVSALEMVRDADEDCKRDGLPRIPICARAKIDAALGKAAESC